MFGKWHLSDLPGSDSIALCAGGRLSFTNATYAQVRRDVRLAGFTHVADLYPCNVPRARGNSPYSHNMEWIVEEAIRFMRATIHDQRRFFACNTHQNRQTTRHLLQSIASMSAYLAFAVC